MSSTSLRGEKYYARLHASGQQVHSHIQVRVLHDFVHEAHNFRTAPPGLRLKSGLEIGRLDLLPEFVAGNATFSGSSLGGVREVVRSHLKSSRGGEKTEATNQRMDEIDGLNESKRKQKQIELKGAVAGRQDRPQQLQSGRSTGNEAF